MAKVHMNFLSQVIKYQVNCSLRVGDFSVTCDHHSVLLTVPECRLFYSVRGKHLGYHEQVL